jgi:hypothetical protein
MRLIEHVDPVSRSPLGVDIGGIGGANANSVPASSRLQNQTCNFNPQQHHHHLHHPRPIHLISSTPQRQSSLAPSPLLSNLPVTRSNPLTSQRTQNANPTTHPPPALRPPRHSRRQIHRPRRRRHNNGRWRPLRQMDGQRRVACYHRLVVISVVPVRGRQHRYVLHPARAHRDDGAVQYGECGERRRAGGVGGEYEECLVRIELLKGNWEMGWDMMANNAMGIASSK